MGRSLAGRGTLVTTILKETRPRSRGRVRCNACHRTIAKGSRYERQSVADNGFVWDWVSCPACADVTAAVFAYVGDGIITDEAIGPEDYRDWASDAMGVASSECSPTWWISIDPARFGDGPEGDLVRARCFYKQLARADARTAAEDANPDRAWDDEAWEAFTWRMRTSTSLHPNGVQEV